MSETGTEGHILIDFIYIKFKQQQQSGFRDKYLGSKNINKAAKILPEVSEQWSPSVTETGREYLGGDIREASEVMAVIYFLILLVGKRVFF